MIHNNWNKPTIGNKKYTWMKFIFALICAAMGLIYVEDMAQVAEQIRIIFIMLFLLFTFQGMRDLDGKEKEKEK